MVNSDYTCIYIYIYIRDRRTLDTAHEAVMEGMVLAENCGWDVSVLWMVKICNQSRIVDYEFWTQQLKLFSKKHHPRFHHWLLGPVFFGSLFEA